MIDTHTHLCDERFDEDLSDVVARAIASGIDRFILPGTDDDKHDKLFATVSSYPNNMYATVGLHPTYINNNAEYRCHLERVRTIAKNPPLPIVAIGETGMDLHWSVDFVREQKEGFIFQVELALECNLPLIIHSRDAWEHTFEVLEPYNGKVRGVLHSYSGSIAETERALALKDFYFGINGTVTYKNSMLPAAVEIIPTDRLVLETDAPYLPPVPHRGERNESAYISHIAQKVAEIKSVPTGVIAELTTRNAETLFAL